MKTERVTYLLLIVLTGCTMDANVKVLESGTIECRDFRDDEIFRYHTDTIRNARIGVGASSHFTVTDTKGRTRTIREPPPDYLKCGYIK